jgi:lipoprotein-anchoring transpeptidase ErfK/SrfK
MEVRMARRGRFSKPLTLAITLTAIVVAVAVLYKLLGAADSDQNSNADAFATRTITPGAPDTKLAAIKTDTPPTATPTVATPAPIRVAVPTVATVAENTTPPTTAPVAPKPTQTQPPVTFSGDARQLIEQADAKRKSEDLLEARKLLVAAIDTGKLSEAEHDDVLRRLSQINDVVVFSPKKFITDETASLYKVQPGDLMQKIAAKYDTTWQFIGRLNGITDPRKLQVGKTLKIIKGPLHAKVDKSDFTLDVYIGKPGSPGAIFLKRFRVGLGEHDSTPTGEWLVDTKLENPRYYSPRPDGPRVIEPDDPTNPLGERWIALIGQTGQAVGKTSYGIHGTIEPDSIGKKKSMGCIRLLNEDVELVYDMLIPGKSTVTVVD